MVTIGERQHTTAPLNAHNPAGEPISSDLGKASLNPAIPTQRGKWQNSVIKTCIVIEQGKISS
jgi:hypothetical protein